MKNIIPILFLALMFSGCATPIIEPSDMRTIESKSMSNDPGLTRYAYPWMYTGSDQEYDYVIHSGVIFDRDRYRIERGKLKLQKRFKRTGDKSKWIPINADGSTIYRNPSIELQQIVPNQGMDPTESGS